MSRKSKSIPKSVGRAQDAINRKRANPNISLTSAARAEHTTIDTIHKVNAEFELATISKKGRHYEVAPFSENNEVLIVDSDYNILSIEVNSKYAKIIGSYWGYFEWGKVANMQKVAHENIIRDVYGMKYRLTDDYDFISQLRQSNNKILDPFAGYTGRGS